MKPRAIALVTLLGLATAADILGVTPLAGGVAAGIGVVRTTMGDFCVKFVLERLRVAQDWRVPVSRNRAEYDWLAFAGTVVPGLFGRDDASAGFAMQLITGPDVVLWKTALLGSASRGQVAVGVGDALGRIHRASVAPGVDRAPFANRDLFCAIRIDPCLNFTATRHADIAERLSGLANSVYQAEQTLIHRDVSPKNILIRGASPVIPDAECATMGDPAFDLAFCITHLVLKAAHVVSILLASIARFWTAYVPHVNWAEATELQARVAVVPALMLTRIDGKSPVESLSEPARGQLRHLSRDLPGDHPASLAALVGDIAAAIGSNRRSIPRSTRFWPPGSGIAGSGIAGGRPTVEAEVQLAQTYGRTPSLPLPEVQIFGGGAHAGRRTDVQDVMVMVPGAAKDRLMGVADEGGWWPDFASNEQALETLIRAIELTGEKPGDRVVVSLAVAASEFGRDGRYSMALDRRVLDAGQMIDLLGGWIDACAIACIEDPLAEDDRAGMQAFTARFGGKVQIIGDDYHVTNAGLIATAAADRACNAALIKANQAGTLTETIAAVTAAEAAGWDKVVSARSGETWDMSISHMAVGLGAGQQKVGSITWSERLAKWNELLRIGEDARAGGVVRGQPLAATW